MKSKKTILQKITREISHLKRKYVKPIVTWYAKITYKYYKRSGIASADRPTSVIVSLTSYGLRLSTAYLSIHTILCQSFKPNRVILWLAHGEKIPQNLTKLCQRGLEIKYCDDLKSYKKIIPALIDYPNAIIVTADDDIIYRSKWLEKLYKSYLSDPSVIWAHRAYPMHLIGPKEITSFSEKPRYYGPDCKYDFLFLCTGAGLLIPPGSLSEKVLDVETFKDLCYSCDDTWITAMAILKGTVCKIVPKPYSKLITTPKSQTISLWAENKEKQDGLLRTVFTHFNLYERLR